jgi:DNA-binding transcriptional LysR family regulator
MSFAHLYGLDLNLLLALDALLAERSVTRAARRVGLTQPAMSRALGRLRAALGDALLVRSGRGLVATPRAEALQERLHASLEQLEGAVYQAPRFAPATCRRIFHLATADYGVAVVVPPLLRRLATEAPGVGIVVHPQGGGEDEALAEGRLDALLGPRRPSARGLVWTRLFSEGFVCLVQSARRSLPLRAYCQAGHLFVSPALQASGVVDEALARRGLQRRIAATVPSFLVAPLLVAQTDLVATLPRRIAALFESGFAVRTLPLPIDLPSFTVSLAWHERARRDPAHAWFRRLLVEVSREEAAPA